MANSEKSILVRQYNPQVDVNFITTTMNKSLRDIKMFFGVHNTTYYSCMNQMILEMLERCECMILSNPDSPEMIYGFMLYEKIDDVFVLHFIYTKQTFRRMGLVNFMLGKVKYDSKAHNCYTFHTRNMDWFKKRYNLYYNPFIHMLNFKSEPVEETTQEEVSDAQ
jgi:hypothetical protein